MNEAHLQELITIEKTYWWHIAKRELLVDILEKYCPPPGKVIEGGIGGAGTLSTLKKLGYQVSGFDIMHDSVTHARTLGLNAEVHDVMESWPSPEQSVDVVIMQDVIEHLDDPVLALKNAANSLKPDGHVILTVPACPFLMGPWDKMLGHHRRYTEKLLTEQALEAGLKVIWMSHWNTAILPLAIPVRLMEKTINFARSEEFPKVSPLTNALLVFVTNIERWFITKCPLPMGLSIVGVFSK